MRRGGLRLVYLRLFVPPHSLTDSQAALVVVVSPRPGRWSLVEVVEVAAEAVEVVNKT